MKEIKTDRWSIVLPEEEKFLAPAGTCVYFSGYRHVFSEYILRN